MKKFVAVFFVFILLSSSISFAATSKIAEGTGASGSSSSSSTHIYLNGKLVESIESGGDIKYFHQDYLGSTRIVTDRNGQQLARLDYEPFGSMLVNNDNVKYTFTGKEKDISTNLQYFGARYYDADTGRFTQVDPKPDFSKGSYNYAENNPMKMVDPTGKEAVEPDTLVRVYGAPTHELLGGPSFFVVGTFAGLALKQRAEVLEYKMNIIRSERSASRAKLLAGNYEGWKESRQMASTALKDVKYLRFGTLAKLGSAGMLFATAYITIDAFDYANREGYKEGGNKGSEKATAKLCSSLVCGQVGGYIGSFTSMTFAAIATGAELPLAVPLLVPVAAIAAIVGGIGGERFSEVFINPQIDKIFGKPPDEKQTVPWNGEFTEAPADQTKIVR